MYFIYSYDFCHSTFTFYSVIAMFLFNHSTFIFYNVMVMFLFRIIHSILLYLLSRGLILACVYLF